MNLEVLKYNEYIGMNFLKNLTITIKKIPEYLYFKKTYNVEVDYYLLNEIMKDETIPEFTNDRKMLLEPILKKINKRSGVLEISYSQPYGLGRSYAKNSISPICVSRHIKHTLFQYLGWVDIDLIKSYPSMLYSLFKNNNMELTTFGTYLTNPEAIFEELVDYYSLEKRMSHDNIKDCFSAMIFGGGVDCWKESLIKDGVIFNTDITTHSFILEFKQECKLIMNSIVIQNKELFDHLKKETDEYHDTCNRVMSYYCGIIENDILHTITTFLIKKKVISCKSVLFEYDGLCFKPNSNIELQPIIYELNSHIQDKYKMKINVKIKPYAIENVHNEIIEKRRLMDIVLIRDLQLKDVTSFAEFKCIFELTHFKVINKSCFIHIIKQDGVIKELKIMSKKEIQVSYEHITYFDDKDKPKSYINDWLVNKYIRVYDDIECIPPPLICPANIYNLWTPFLIEGIEINDDAILEDLENGLEIIKNYILNLCDNNTETCNDLLLWLGQMLVYPAIKSIVPTIISDEGAGKGNFLQLIRNLMGSSKVLETRTPNTDVWGSFNSLMVDAFLVNCDELSAVQQKDADGIIKGLITNRELTINTKGLKQFRMNSYHRFLMTSNKEFCVASSAGDRRNLIIRSSDDKCRKTPENIKFHDDYISVIEDLDKVRFFYDWLCSLDGLDTFHKKMITKTAYQNELIQSTLPAYELFFEKFVSDFRLEDEVTMTSKTYYERFNKWKETYGIKYEISYVGLMRNTNLLKKKLPLNSITHSGSRHASSNIYNLTLLRNHYKIPNSF